MKIINFVLAVATFIITFNSYAELPPGMTISHYGGAFTNVSSSDSRMFIQRGSRSFDYYDNSNPLNPSFLNSVSIPTIEGVAKMKAMGNYLFLLATSTSDNGSGYQTLWLIETTDAKNPKIKPFFGSARNLDIVGNLIYIIGAGESDLSIHTFDPASNSLRAIEWFGSSRDNSRFVKANGNYVFLSDGNKLNVIKRESTYGNLVKIASFPIPSYSDENIREATAYFIDGKMYFDFISRELYELDLNNLNDPRAFHTVPGLTECPGQYDKNISRTFTKNALIISCNTEIKAFDSSTFQLISKEQVKARSYRLVSHPQNPSVFYSTNVEDNFNAFSVYQLEENKLKKIKSLTSVSSIGKLDHNSERLIFNTRSTVSPGIALNQIRNGVIKEKSFIVFKENITDIKIHKNRMLVTTMPAVLDKRADTLYLYDISNLENPEFVKSIRVSTLPNVYPDYLEANNDYYFVSLSNQDIVFIFNHDLELVSSFGLKNGQAFGDGTSIAIKDHYLYHTGRLNSLVTYDFSNLKDVKVVNETNNFIGTSVRVEGDTLYVGGTWLDTFSTFNITLPAPQMIGKGDYSTTNDFFDVSQNKGIAVYGGTGRHSEITFWDFSNLSRPSHIGDLDFFGQSKDVAIIDGIYYITHPNEGLLIVK